VTITAYAAGGTLKKAHIDIINAGSKLLTFGHKGSHVDTFRYCAGATIAHVVDGEWNVQVIQWGAVLPEHEMRQIVYQFIGLDQ